jgi:hypothetical protein
MRHWTKRLFAIAAPLLLTGCLWGPGKFTSDLTLRNDGSFILDYRGEIVLQTPPDTDAKPQPWNPARGACYKSGKTEVLPDNVPMVSRSEDSDDPTRPCTAAELTKLKLQYEGQAAEQAAKKRKDNGEMAKMFGLPGLDDESSRAFAAKLMKYAGWRSVRYRGGGVFDVDYHLAGRATQDFMFPLMPDNDLLVPFIAIRRRADGSVLVTAPAMTGGAGPLAARAGKAAGAMGPGGPVSRAQGRLTVITDGEILTNNSEDGAAARGSDREVHWDVGPSSTKIPEMLVSLR